ncbi:MAG: hypothetical protein WBC04_22240, partial [Candidatus Acidiferrales bacterium]
MRHNQPSRASTSLRWGGLLAATAVSWLIGIPEPATAEQPATGAIQFFRGEITKIEGDKLYLRLPSSREVSVLADTNTNMVCPSRLPEETEV